MSDESELPPPAAPLPPPTPGWAPPAPTVSVVSHPEPAPPWWRRRVAALPVAAWLAVGAVAIAAIVVGGLMLGGDDEARLAIDVDSLATVAPAGSTPPVTNSVADPDPVTTPPTTARTVTPTTSAVPDSAPPTTTPGSVPDTAPTTTPGTAPPVALGDGSEPDGPLPAGDPEQSAFEYDDGFGAVWSGTISGVVETPLYFDDETGERCFVVLGTLTPEVVDGLVSDSWSTPYLTLFIDGDEAELGDQSCETEPLATAGYRSLYDATATVGTALAFYAEFSLPQSAGAPQAVAVGDGEEWTFFDATLLAAVPDVEPGPVGALPVDPVPLAPGAPGTFTHLDEYTGDSWSGTVSGVIEIPLDEFSDVEGRCFAVVGTLTADALGSGLTSSPYGAPPLAVVADGVLVDDYYGCSSEEAESAGYAWFNDTEVTAGTTVAVYATLIVPAPAAGELQAIVVGDAWGDAPTVFAPLVLDEVAPAALTPGPAPAAELAAVGTRLVVEQEYDETTWDVVVHGMIVEGDCVVVYSRSTLTAGEPQVQPELFLVAGGRLLPEAFDCDDSAATEAGYVEQWTEVQGVGASVDAYAAFRLPAGIGDAQAIVVGRTGLSEPVAVAPTVIAAIPPIPR